MRRLALVLAAATVLSIACREQQPLQPPGSTGPAYLISDGAHCVMVGTTCEPGNPDFFFLPPLVADPSSNRNFDVGQFNAALSPVVEVCTLTGDPSGGSPVACMMSGGNPVLVFGPVTMALDLTSQQYTRNWDTSLPQPLVATNFYRIIVRGAPRGTALGFLDIDPVDQGVKNVRTGEVIQFQDGRTLPLKVRIENGAFGAKNKDHFEGTIRNFATIARTNTFFAGASFQDNWLPQAAVVAGITQVVLIIDRIPVDNTMPGMNCLDSGLLEKQGCYRFQTDPDLFQFGRFNKSVVVGVCIELHDVLMTNSPYQLYRREEEADSRRLFALPSQPATFLNCETFAPELPPSPIIGAIESGRVLELARASWRAFAKGLGRLLQPRALYAIDLGAGGSTDGPGFSRYGWARSVMMTKDASTENQSAVAGTRVALDPKVCLVATHPTVSPPVLMGEPVTFTVAPGGGTIGGAGSVVVNTGEDGCASAAWVLGASPGANTLTAMAVAMGSPQTFTATGIPGIRVSGFTSPRNPAPLVDPSGNASTALSGSSNIVSALGDVTKFGASGTVGCGVRFLPFVTSIAPGSLVDELGNRRVDVFFAGLTTTTLSSGEAAELAAFLGAGGILYLAGDTDNGDGPSYNPLFTALGVSDVYSDQILTSVQSSGQSSNPTATPVTTGPFGVVGPLEHTGFRIITTSSMSTVAAGNGVTSTLVAEGAFGSGRIAAMGDPLYWNQFTVADADNQRYFLNLFALGCPAVIL